MTTFAKPENALKRAEELINVGQKQAALQALHGLITSKRYRAWQKTLEKIMFKYVELCVDMRKGRFAKDGLIQYRIVCQQVNVNSLEEVIKHFMHLSTERAEQARSQAQALEDALDVDDLEADKRPEDLMLSFVSGEKGRDRSDRELMTAHRAFQFCKQYKRTTEFRRLCEIIRNHLANLNKYRDQRDRPDLSAPESLQLYVDTRFEQLKNATELGLWQISQSSLLSELFVIDSATEASKGVVSCVSQEVKDLFHLLGQEFLPLDLASKIQPLLAKISKIGGKLSSASSVPEVQLSQYVPALEKLTTLRVLQQVSQVYQTMKIQVLSGMIPFFDFSVVEKISMDAVKYNFVAMKVNHLKGVVFFGSMDLDSDRLRNHLANFAESLNKARSMIYPPALPQIDQDSLSMLADTVDREHKRLLARKSIIERRKEEQERQMLEMEREEESKRLKLQKITEEAEQKRLQSEYSRREEQRIRREIEERELEEAQALLQEAEKRSKKKGKKPVIEGEKVTKQSLMELALSEQLRERQEMEKKLQKMAKTMDYLERAKREEEVPLIEEAYMQHLVVEKAVHEREQLQEIELSRQHHAGDLLEKIRLARMLDNKSRITSRREEEYNRLKKEREDRIRQLIAMRKQEMDKKRKLLFYIKSEEERLTKLREEEEARKREEAERRKKEEEERRAKLDEIAERQRQRERELEEKEKLRREALLGRPSEPFARPAEQANGARPVEQPGAATASAALPSAPATGKYVPRFRRERSDSSSPTATAEPPETDHRRSRHDDQPPATTDRWRSDERREIIKDEHAWGRIGEGQKVV
ncbi:hypothetical protein ACLOJK_028999 [Asimina triloba]